MTTQENRVGQIHPKFMRGEYLPNHGRREVEIERFMLESTTSDVVSLRDRHPDQIQHS